MYSLFEKAKGIKLTLIERGTIQNRLESFIKTHSSHTYPDGNVEVNPKKLAQKLLSYFR